MPASSNDKATSDAVRLHPKWYISRGQGIHVPLIPVDELPNWINLRGAPRTMDTSPTHGLKWLGAVPLTGEVYNLELSSTEPQELPIRPVFDYRTEEQQQIPRSSHAAPAREDSKEPKHLEVSEPKRSGQTKMKHASFERTVKGRAGNAPSTRKNSPASLNSASLRATPTRRPLPPSGIEPDLSKKVYCTYWIRTGECDYVQAGCFYKHEMPDYATLRKIGFRNIPSWWREKEAARKLATPHNNNIAEKAALKCAKRREDPRRETNNLGAIGSEREQARQAGGRVKSTSSEFRKNKPEPMNPARKRGSYGLAKSRHAPLSPTAVSQIRPQRNRPAATEWRTKKVDAGVEADSDDLLISPAWPTLLPELSPPSSAARDSPQSKDPATPPRPPATQDKTSAEAIRVHSASSRKEMVVPSAEVEFSPCHRFASEQPRASQDHIVKVRVERKMSDKAGRVKRMEELANQRRAQSKDFRREVDRDTSKRATKGGERVVA